MNYKKLLMLIDAQLETGSIGDITTMVQEIESRIKDVGAEKTAQELTENAKDALQEYMKLDYKDPNAKEWRQAHNVYYEAARDLDNAIAAGENPTKLSQNALANMVKSWESIDREMGKSAQLVPKDKASALKKLVLEAENIAEEIEESFTDESPQFWYWHDIRVALSEVINSL